VLRTLRQMDQQNGRAQEMVSVSLLCFFARVTYIRMELDLLVSQKSHFQIQSKI
jgi:hypothetical protein